MSDDSGSDASTEAGHEGGSGDANGTDGIVPFKDSGCDVGAGATTFSCSSNGGNCIAPAQYCSEVSPGCATIPPACSCDYSCDCLLSSVSIACPSQQKLMCQMNGGGATLFCQ